jgi:hypothetical protein
MLALYWQLIGSYWQLLAAIGSYWQLLAGWHFTRTLHHFTRTLHL